MPESFQALFWTRYHPSDLELIDLERIIEDMDLAELGKFLKLIGEEISRRN